MLPVLLVVVGRDVEFQLFHFASECSTCLLGLSLSSDSPQAVAELLVVLFAVDFVHSHQPKVDKKKHTDVNLHDKSE